MWNRQHPSNGNFSEHNEHTIQQVGANTPPVSSPEEQRLLDHLLESGFTWEESLKLLHQRTHLYENTEMQQRVADDCRIHFARWLYEQGEINEE